MSKRWRLSDAGKNRETSSIHADVSTQSETRSGSVPVEIDSEGVYAHSEHGEHGEKEEISNKRNDREVDMSEVSNPTAPKYDGLPVDHPRIIEYGRNCKKLGMSIERASKIIGVPHEVVEKIYRDAPKAG